MDIFFEELFKYMKSAYFASLSAMTMVQDQSERTLNMSIIHSNVWQEESKKSVTEWLTAMRKQRQEYQKLVEDNLKVLETTFLKKSAK